jgi:hypothetical protein
MDLIDLLTNKKNYDKINDLWWSMLGSRTYWGEHKKQNNELIEEGIGIYNVRHEAKHAGIFKNNTANGIGLKTWSHGEKTACFYIDNQKNGYGLHCWPSGAKFIGRFKHNMPHGPGMLITVHDGLRYIGWVDGQDCLIYPPGEWYDKNYNIIKPERYNINFEGYRFIGNTNKKGKYHGYGILINVLGTEKEGNFINGKEEGKITERYKFGPGAGTIVLRHYNNGIPHKHCLLIKILYGNVFETYEGETEQGLYSGKGKLTYPNGMEQVGTFSNGLYQPKKSDFKG